MKKKVISILCGTMFVILAGSLYFVTRPDQAETIMLTNASEEAETDVSGAVSKEADIFAEDSEDAAEKAEGQVSGEGSSMSLGENSKKDAGASSQEDTTQTHQSETEVSAIDQSATGKDSEVTTSAESHKICIYVCGAVKTPGVYYLSEEARAVQAIDAAGGFTDQADKEYINLARTISDGEKLYIPTLEETEEMAFSSLEEEVQTETKQNTAVSEESQAKSSGKVNINTAGKEELMTLNGIGEAKAESIISYRDANGPFQCKEDIMNITGIKDALYQKITDYICVTNEK